MGQRLHTVPRDLKLLGTNILNTIINYNVSKLKLTIQM